ncbi:hypothetical protein ACEZCY_21400 [Streptacidiphilus sp. N1-12]|uniref:Uncharacterized protein n=2 Tax=Streptacidiphilus alkalitolerans TaxID=3342712 RepID=A0ABV6WIB0_9ACTN
MSTRTLLRRVREQVRQAQFLLGTTAHPVDRIAGVSPRAYRDAVQ